jgi:hypothetical protein
LLLKKSKIIFHIGIMACWSKNFSYESEKRAGGYGIYAHHVPSLMCLLHTAGLVSMYAARETVSGPDPFLRITREKDQEYSTMQFFLRKHRGFDLLLIREARVGRKVCSHTFLFVQMFKRNVCMTKAWLLTTVKNGRR